MAAIRGRNTNPELLVRSYLHSRGLRFHLHGAGLKGRPDVVLPRYRTVVFVHGCFWHQHTNCRFAVMPKSNRRFWLAKLSANQRRDRLTASSLRRAGWHVLTIWECNLDKIRLERLVRRIRSYQPVRKKKGRIGA